MQIAAIVCDGCASDAQPRSVAPCTDSAAAMIAARRRGDLGVGERPVRLLEPQPERQALATVAQLLGAEHVEQLDRHRLAPASDAVSSVRRSSSAGTDSSTTNARSMSDDGNRDTGRACGTDDGRSSRVDRSSCTHATRSVMPCASSTPGSTSPTWPTTTSPSSDQGGATRVQPRHGPRPPTVARRASALAQRRTAATPGRTIDRPSAASARPARPRRSPPRPASTAARCSDSPDSTRPASSDSVDVGDDAALAELEHPPELEELHARSVGGSRCRPRPSPVPAAATCAGSTPRRRAGWPAPARRAPVRSAPGRRARGTASASPRTTRRRPGPGAGARRSRWRGRQLAGVR